MNTRRGLAKSTCSSICILAIFLLTSSAVAADKSASKKEWDEFRLNYLKDPKFELKQEQGGKRCNAGCPRAKKRGAEPSLFVLHMKKGRGPADANGVSGAHGYDATRHCRSEAPVNERHR